jgi:hypothetical protein
MFDKKSGGVLRLAFIDYQNELLEIIRTDDDRPQN